MYMSIFWDTVKRLIAPYFLCLLVDPEDGGSAFLRNSDEFYRTTRRNIIKDITLKTSSLCFPLTFSGVRQFSCDPGSD
jgi:hypothetical protein